MRALTDAWVVIDRMRSRMVHMDMRSTGYVPVKAPGLVIQEVVYNEHYNVTEPKGTPTTAPATLA